MTDKIDLDKVLESSLKNLLGTSSILQEALQSQTTLAQTLQKFNMVPSAASEAAAMMAGLFGANRASLIPESRVHSDALAAMQATFKVPGIEAFGDTARMSDRLTQPQNYISNLYSLKWAFPETLYSNYSAINDLTRAIALPPALDIATLFSHPSVLTDLNQLHRTINALPDWMKPLSDIQAFQPSWKIAAGIGLTGAANVGLVHDVLSALHRDRVSTVAFETSVQMLEVLDVDDTDLTDRVIEILRTCVTPIFDLIAQVKDEVARAGLITVLVLILNVVQCFEAYEALQPSASQQEIQRQLGTISGGLSQLQKDKKLDRDIRAVIQAAPLRDTPDAKGRILRKVYPDDRVRVLDVEGSWAHVEVYEYHSEKTSQGWINRRVLRLLAAD